MNPTKTQFSLRTVLIALGCIGAGIGLAGRLYRYEPEILLTVVRLLVPLTYAAAIAWTAFRRNSKHTTAVWMTIVASLVMLAYFASGIGKNSIRYLPAKYLVERKLFSFTDDGRLVDRRQVWQELSHRFVNKRLSDENVQLIFQTMEQKLREREVRPEYQFFSAQNTLRMMASSGEVSDAQLASLGEVYFGKPHPKSLRVRQSGFPLHLALDYGFNASNQDHPTTLLWQTSRVQINGQDADVTLQNNKNSSPLVATIEEPLPVGVHNVSVELECALVKFDEVGATIRGKYPKELWPRKPTKQWIEHVVFPVQVFPDDAEIIKLTTKEELNPASSFKISIRQMRRKSGPFLLFQTTFSKDPPVAVSGDLTVVMDGRELVAGNIIFEPGTKRRPRGLDCGLNWPTNAKSPVGSVATVHFKPETKYMERNTTVTEIWGTPLVFENIPIGK